MLVPTIARHYLAPAMPFHRSEPQCRIAFVLTSRWPEDYRVGLAYGFTGVFSGDRTFDTTQPRYQRRLTEMRSFVGVCGPRFSSLNEVFGTILTKGSALTNILAVLRGTNDFQAAVVHRRNHLG